MLLDFANDMNNDYKARMLAKNKVFLELAIPTDCYVTEINGEIVVRKGPNTDAVMKYMKDKGYPLNSTLEDNIETMRKYGKDNNKDSSVSISKDIEKKLTERGYKWIE